MTSSPVKALSPGEIVDVIARCASEVIPDIAGHQFRPDDRLDMLGANSMDRVEIITLVLEALALRIARTEVFGPKNIGELAELLHAKLCA